MTTDATRANAQAMPFTPFAFAGPEDCPDIYAMVTDGDCLTPVFPHDTTLLFSRSEPFAPGDYVAIWLDPDCVQPGEHSVIVKRLVFASGIACGHGWLGCSPISPALVVEYLFPKLTRIGINPGKVLAVHRCLGAMPDNASPMRTISAGEPHTRRELEAAIENAIALLDEMDGEDDLEPMLGATENHPGRGDPRGRGGAHDDWFRPTGLGSDDELSLGWNNEGRQSLLTDSQRDLEPDLGTTERIDQTHRTEGYASIPFLPGDAEPSLGWTDSEDQSGIGQQDASFVLDECEEEPSGYGDAAGMSDDMLGEPSLGYTEETDQVRRLQSSAKRGQIDGEPDLGWCETDSQGADELPTDDDMPALSIDPDGDNSEVPFVFKGEGYQQARKALQEANRRNPLPEDPERPRFIEKAVKMPDGSVLRTYVMQNFIPVREANRPAEAVDLRSRLRGQ